MMSAPKAGDGSAKTAPRDPRAPSGTVPTVDAPVIDDPHEKDTIVPPYDVESYAKMAAEMPVPITRSISVLVNRINAPGVSPAPPGTGTRISIPPPPTVRRPDLASKGILDDPGALHRVPRRVVSGERLQNSMLDHREGFVLSLIDGQLDIEAIVDVCGMPMSEVLEILESFRLSGVISLD